MNNTDERSQLTQVLKDLVQSTELALRLAKAEADARDRSQENMVDEYVRVHFWKVSAHLYSIRRMVVPCCESRILWDLSGVAALARAIIDAALGLAYWRDNTHPDEFTLKAALYLFHEKNRELQMLRTIGSERSGEISERAGLVEEIRAGLETNPVLAGMHSSKRSKALNGDLPRLLSNEEILVRSGLNVAAYQAMWRTLSMHLHAHPHATSWLRNFSADDADSMRIMRFFIQVSIYYSNWAALQFDEQFPSPAAVFDETERAKAQSNADTLRVDIRSV